jgi:hypothetical protein
VLSGRVSDGFGEGCSARQPDLPERSSLSDNIGMTVFTPQKATGSHFYRYQSADHLEWLEPIILRHLLYNPAVAELNDPTDCRPKIMPMSEEEMVTYIRNDYIRRNPVLALDLLEKYTDLIRERIHALGLEWFMRELSRILNEQMGQFRVFSMTKRYDNLSLWAKYAANHTGYCLEFLNEGPLFGEYAWEVMYEEYTRFDVNDAQRSADFLVHKRPEWSNEEEVRLIRALGSGPLVMIQPQWLTRIILGMNMSPENRRQIRSWSEAREPKLLVVEAYFDSLVQEIRLKTDSDSQSTFPC